MTSRTDKIMALAEAYAIGINAIEFPDYSKERLAVLRAEVQALEDEATFNKGMALGFKHRAEKAEAELARLTPTEDEQKLACDIIEEFEYYKPDDKHVPALLRKFVLRETA